VEPGEDARTCTELPVQSQTKHVADGALAHGASTSGEAGLVVQEAFASVHDLVHWAILLRPARRATLRQIYVTCVEHGRVKHKRGGGSRLLTSNEHWKSQVRHALYTSPRFQRDPELEDGWMISPSHMYVPKTTPVMVDASQVAEAMSVAEAFKAKLVARSPATPGPAAPASNVSSSTKPQTPMREYDMRAAAESLRSLRRDLAAISRTAGGKGWSGSSSSSDDTASGPDSGERGGVPRPLAKGARSCRSTFALREADANQPLETPALSPPRGQHAEAAAAAASAAVLGVSRASAFTPTAKRPRASSVERLPAAPGGLGANEEDASGSEGPQASARDWSRNRRKPMRPTSGRCVL